MIVTLYCYWVKEKFIEGQKFRCAVGCQCARMPEGYQMISTLDDGHYNSQASAEACQIECQNTNGCEYWTWDPGKGYQNSNRNYTVGTAEVVTLTIRVTLPNSRNPTV